jgi:hypothetical protein
MKFKYLIKPVDPAQLGPDQIATELNSLGDAGWEVVAIYDRGGPLPTFVLKKTIESGFLDR